MAIDINTIKTSLQSGKYSTMQSNIDTSSNNNTTDNELTLAKINADQISNVDFFETVLNEKQTFKDSRIGLENKIIVYKPKKPFFVATDGVRIVKGSEKMDGNYLLPLLERNKPQSEGYKRYYSILADIDVFFTENHEEQSKIGEYFSELDHLITLHQRK